MALLFGLVLLAILAIPLVVSLRRANELFVVSVSEGQASLRRGRIPQGLLGDIGDVVRRPRVKKATIRVVKEGGRPRVYVQGQLSEVQRQRLRNVVGNVPVAKIQAGAHPARSGRPKRRRGPRRG